MPYKNATNQMKINIRLIAYNAATIIAGPFFFARKLSRYIKKNYRYEFDIDRHKIPFSPPTVQNSTLPHVVFIISGLGEKQMAEQLTLGLLERYPNIRITWAIKVAEIVAMVQREQPDQSVTYMPFDNFISVNRWFKCLKPDVIVSIENLWMPNIAWVAKDRGAKVVVVCGSSERFKSQGLRGAMWRPINLWSLRAIDIICLHSESFRETLKNVLPPEADVRITGVIKLKRRQTNEPPNESLAQWISPHADTRIPLLAAGSTRNEEEEAFVLDAFNKVREVHPCRLLLAPRHVHRATEVEKFARDRGFTTQRRSQYSSFLGNSEESPADILILDTLGELTGSYQFCKAAFIGGTLRAPGHNVIEPVEKGIPVSFGPGRGEPTLTQKACIENGIGFRVTSPDELANHWIRILTDDTWAQSLRACAHHILKEQEQIFSANIEAVIELIESYLYERSKKSDTGLHT